MVRHISPGEGHVQYILVAIVTMGPGSSQWVLGRVKEVYGSVLPGVMLGEGLEL
jgi:hypothetical protein